MQDGKGAARIKVSTLLQLKFPRIFSFLKKIEFSRRGHIERFRQTAKDVDFLIFGGGNLLMSKMGSDYGYRVARVLEAVKMPVAIFECGAGPFLNDKKYICSTIQRLACHLSVRDSFSKEQLAVDGLKNRAVVTSDPAFFVSEVVPQSIESDRNFLGINVIFNFFNEKELDYLADQIVKISRKRNLKVKIINSAFPKDGEVADELRHQLLAKGVGQDEIEVVDLKADLSNLGETYGSLACFAGTRMHSLIFALSYGVPAVGFCWDEKVRGMFRNFYGDEYREALVLEGSYGLDEAVEAAEMLDLPLALRRAKQSIELDVENLLRAVEESKANKKIN